MSNNIITPYASFTRPANTTAYADTDLVANDTVAGSVVPLAFGIGSLPRGRGVIMGARIFKDHQTITNANFNLHLFRSSPAVTNGDNGTFAVSTAENYIGAVVLDMTTGAFVTGTDSFKRGSSSVGIGGETFQTYLFFDLDQVSDRGRVIYGLLEAKAAYTPQSAEQFKVWLEISDG